MNERRAVAVLVIGAAMAILAPPARAGALSGRDVMARNEDARRLRDVMASATLTTTSEGGDTKAKSFTWWHKLAEDGVHFRTLTRFSQPAEIRGEGILIDEHASENDVLLYLPRFKKVRRVEGQSQSSSFMGSVFSYSDLADPHTDDYKHGLVRSEACPGATEVSCFVVESLPASDAIRERTGYSRTLQWVRSDNFITVHGELFDAQGALWKRLDATNVREVDPKAHKWLAHTARIEDVKSKRVTVLVFDQVKVNTGIADSTFTQQNLSRD